MAKAVRYADNLELRRLEYASSSVDYIKLDERIKIVDTKNLLNGDVSSFKKAYLLSKIEENQINNEKSLDYLIHEISDLQVSFIEF